MRERAPTVPVESRPTPTRPLSVDIIIDNYNYADFLAAAIDSALAQTHPRTGVCVVDDGSSDESRDIIRAYGDRITSVLKANGGQASAMNAGIAVSEADVVIFLDSDDVLLPRAAELLVAAFHARPEAVRAHGRMSVIDEAGRLTGQFKPAPHLPMPEGLQRHATLTYPFDVVWLPTSGNAFTMRALRQISPIPEDEFVSCADWYLVHVSSLLGAVASVDETVALYRVHGRNGYEPRSSRLELAHVRETAKYAATTSRHLERWARDLDLEFTPGRMVAFSDIANRAILLRLDAERRSSSPDRLRRLLWLGAGAATRRDDLGPAMRLVLIAWLVALALSPRPLARRLAELFLYPQRRPHTNRLLRRLTRIGQPATPGPERLEVLP